MKPATDMPNKLQGAEITTLSAEPLIGVLRLDTDTGPIEVAINAAGASILLEELGAFLDTE